MRFSFQGLIPLSHKFYYLSLYKNISLVARILITGARAPVALELARSFHADGHTVFVADTLWSSLTRWSSCVTRYYRLPAPAHDFKNFEKRLLAILNEEKIEHLIPTCEETFYVSQCRNIPESCKVWTSVLPLLDQLHNKQLFSVLAEKYFSVPVTLRCDAFTDWTNTGKYVFKPVYSRFAASTLIGPPAYRCGEPQKNPTGWIAQEMLKGKEISVYSIWENGKMKAYTSYYSRYRAGIGAGIYFEACWHQETFEAVQKMGNDLGYTGQLCFDVMIQDGKSYVLECNPRATSGAHLLGGSLAGCFLNEQTVVVRESPVYTLRLALFGTKPWLVFTRRFYKGSDILFSRKDPKPYLLQLLSLGEMLWKKVIYRQTLLQVTTEDIEWNGDYDQMG